MGTQQMPRPGMDAHTGGAGGGGGKGGGKGGGEVGGGAAPITSSALVIVQLSHLDRYAVVCGERAAQALASRLIHEVHGVQGLHARQGRQGFQGQHVVGAPTGGPVVLADSQWPLGPASAARLRVLTVLSATPQVVWVRQDLTCERWRDAQQRLVVEVQRLRIRSAQVGGCWATRSGAPSWVSTTAAALSWAGIQTQIAPGLCAYEDDLLRLLPVLPPAVPWSATISATEVAEHAAAFRRFLLLF